jgi:small GTP-binding protein
MQKKVALLGAPGVGKTSLVRRFVQSVFDETYLTTIGVKVDKKLVRVDGHDVTLMVWDIAGAEDTFTVPSSYIRGAAGYLLVVDGTRPDTAARAGDLRAQVERDVGALPSVLVLNKVDLADAWRLDEAAVAPISTGGTPVVRSSARTGAGVEDAFLQLARAMISPRPA